MLIIILMFHIVFLKNWVYHYLMDEIIKTFIRLKCNINYLTQTIWKSLSKNSGKQMPAAGAARFWIFYRSSPLQKSENSKKGGICSELFG